MNQSHPTLFSPFKLGNISLKNRIAMAPMTRSRAIGNVPNKLMAEYYKQRATAGLIITEGIAPSPNGLGYSRIPGLYTKEQISGWKLVTDAVHEAGGKIFAQIMHTGRISHPLNMPRGSEIVAPSAIAAATTQMWTDQSALQPLPVPRALRTDELPDVVAEFVHSAKSAIEAGFDGIELHAANGYLLEQFLSPASNQRNDAYGGSPEARNRFVLEVTKAVIESIGKDKVAIRLSPFNGYNDIGSDEHTEAQYENLAKALNELDIVYVHLVDTSAIAGAEVVQSVWKKIRAAFKGSIILNGGYDVDRAEADLKEGNAELISFGSKYISNPDLVQRLATGAELSNPDPNTFFSAGVEGYTDYPIYRKTAEMAH